MIQQGDMVYLKLRACRLLARGDHKRVRTLANWRGRVQWVSSTPSVTGTMYARLVHCDKRYRSVPAHLPTSYLTTKKWGRT